MKVTYGTIKNTKQKDKPNEDIALCDYKNMFFLLLDGVSRDNNGGKYPNPSPAVDVVNILKEEIYKDVMSTAMSSETTLNALLNAIKNANEKIYIYNKQEELEFAAGAVGIVALIHENQLFYAYIGDCYGRLVYRDKVVIFTDCQTALINQHKKEYTSYEIREIICNNLEHPYSYGVLNGDKRAIDFIKLGIINIENVKQIILSSDGLENFLANCSIKMLQIKDANELLQEAHKNQSNNQDDRTIIKIELESISR